MTKPAIFCLLTLQFGFTAHAQSDSDQPSAAYAVGSFNGAHPDTGVNATAVTTQPMDPVVFYNSDATLGKDGSNLVWDSTNFSLGLRNPVPVDALDIANGRVRVNSGTKSTEAFNLAGRVGVGIPVPYLTPTTNNSVVAFDLYPKGAPANFTNNTGVAWFDLCSTDVNIDGTNYECLRMGKFANGDAHISSAKGGTGVVRNLDLQINGGKVGIGTTSPSALFSVGSSSPFQVDSNGNIRKLNNVPISFPSSNARGYLVNDGNGNLSYATTLPASAVALKENYTAATLPNQPAIGTTVKVTGGGSISDCTGGPERSAKTFSRPCEWNGSSWRFAPTGGYVLTSQPGQIAPAGIYFAAPGMTSTSPDERLRQYVVAKACQVTNMYANSGGDRQIAGNVSISLNVVRANTLVETGVSAVLPAGALPGTVVSDTSHAVDLNEGDLVSIRIENAASTSVDLLTISINCAY